MSGETAVPASVRRAQEEAEAQRQAAYQAPETGEPGPAEPTEPAAGDSPTEPTEPKAEPSEPAPEPAKGEEETEDETDYKAEYARLKQAHETLQGKYSAEVPRMAQQIRELKDQLTAANEKLESPGAGQIPAEGGTGDAEVDKKIEAVRDEYGEDLIETLTLIARRMVSEATKPLSERVDRMSDGQEETNRASFYTALKGQVANWETINVDPKFHQWLAKVDPLTGKERQAALEEAYGNLDASRVAGIFNLFLEQSERAPGPAGEGGDEGNLEAHREPGSEETVRREPEGPKTYTKADMDKLQKDAREGRIDDATYKARMGELQKAIAEGRYRPT